MYRAARKSVMAVGAVLLSMPLYAADRSDASLPEGTIVSLSTVPASVLSIARDQLETKPTSAKSVSFEGRSAYLLEGTNRYDKHLAVVVAPDGTVLKPVSIWEADDD